MWIFTRKALDQCCRFFHRKKPPKAFLENEEIHGNRYEFDRHLAATKDFVRIEGDKAIYQNHWVAGGNDTVWNMVHYDVQLFGGVVLPAQRQRLRKWQPVKVRLWWLPCPYSSMH